MLRDKISARRVHEVASALDCRDREYGGVVSDLQRRRDAPQVVHHGLRVRKPTLRLKRVISTKHRMPVVTERKLGTCAWLEMAPIDADEAARSRIPQKEGARLSCLLEDHIRQADRGELEAPLDAGRAGTHDDKGARLRGDGGASAREKVKQQEGHAGRGCGQRSGAALPRFWSSSMTDCKMDVLRWLFDSGRTSFVFVARSRGFKHFSNAQRNLSSPSRKAICDTSIALNCGFTKRTPSGSKCSTWACVLEAAESRKSNGLIRGIEQPTAHVKVPARVSFSPLCSPPQPTPTLKSSTSSACGV
eukprot:1305933-Prymnesium_polylepis.1